MKYVFCAYINKKERVDMYLSNLFSDFSRSYIQKMIDKGNLKVNWEALSKNKKIENKDLIELEIITEKLEIVPENLPLEIVFQNSDFAIINKDAGVNTHPVPWEWGKSGTLVNAILYHIKDLGSIGWTERPGIVHRLDKDTSGLIAIAKNDSSMKELQEIIKGREINKYYIAVVWGKMPNSKFKIESEIGRDPNSRIKMTTKNPINAKYALSYWEVLGYIWDKYTVVKIKIETWRTHQIRVHLSSIWFPIIWDQVYAKPKINEEAKIDFWLKRQALHAWELDFVYKWKKYNFSAPLKEDIQKIYNLIS